jgi:hypothetical protein
MFLFIRMYICVYVSSIVALGQPVGQPSVCGGDYCDRCHGWCIYTIVFGVGKAVHVYDVATAADGYYLYACLNQLHDTILASSFCKLFKWSLKTKVSKRG